MNVRITVEIDGHKYGVALEDAEKYLSADIASVVERTIDHHRGFHGNPVPAMQPVTQVEGMQ